MVALYVPDASLFGELSNVVRLFVPTRVVMHATDEMALVNSDLALAVFPAPDDNGTPCVVRMYVNGTCVAALTDERCFLELRSGASNAKRQRLHQAKRAIYRLLSAQFHSSSRWGALTGVRPTKLYRELADRYGEDRAVREFTDSYLVMPDRTSLAAQIVRTQRPFLELGATLVYCGIPFCPTRCRYCSFVSQDAGASKRARSRYLGTLIQEMRKTMSKLGPRQVRGIYLGGGTPTVLSENELDELLAAMTDLFAGYVEFTVEAGRPDTITERKLRVLERYGVTRLCINPQTTSNETLRVIGRAHTAQDFFHAMQLAGGRFKSLNADMIIGLPGEDVNEVRSTVSDILRYFPQSVTVHALSLKNAAEFAKTRAILPSAQQAERMAEVASVMLSHAGYRPYYMYRQKYMSGNLENTGWALPGFESIYNIGNMEETSSVIAGVAGAVSKAVTCNGTRIERAANVKNPEQYIERVDEMVSRKLRLFDSVLSSAADSRARDALTVCVNSGV